MTNGIQKEQTMIESLTYYVDPGHAWLEVSRDVVDGLGVKPSRFSFVNGGFYYLEEDCDWRAFEQAYRAKYGDFPQLKERHTNRDSKVRRYARVSQ